VSCICPSRRAAGSPGRGGLPTYSRALPVPAGARRRRVGFNVDAGWIVRYGEPVSTEFFA
jgi:hypothetical protein